MTDDEKLLKLAEWFDIDDANKGRTGHEVQDDLRRIARRIAELEDVLGECAHSLSFQAVGSSGHDAFLRASAILECRRRGGEEV